MFRLVQKNREDADYFGDIDGRVRVQRGWLAEEMLVQLKLCPGAVTLYKKKHNKPDMRFWIKVTPLGKESDNTNNEDVTEDSVDIHDVRSRLGVWPIVEAAVSYVIQLIRNFPSAKMQFSTFASIICVFKLDQRKTFTNLGQKVHIEYLSVSLNIEQTLYVM